MSELFFDFDLSEFDTEMEVEEAGGRVQLDPDPDPDEEPKNVEKLPGFSMFAGRTWIYPSNMSRREYQFEIVKSCIYKNTLVCLPTGLGKTFIAAVVMYNFYRWYPSGKIIFMAPTKPLVHQQIESCFKVMGIPQSECMELTGNNRLGERTSAWKDKRVFFVTPKVLSNDICRNLLSVKEIRLLVADEAHRAQGNYPYLQIVKDVMRGGAQTRIIALSATPGVDIPSVKLMIQNLCISHIELRDEMSPDITPYTHEKQVKKIIVNMDDEMLTVRRKLLFVLEIYTKKLSLKRAIRNGHNPTTYSRMMLESLRAEFRQNPPEGMPNAVMGRTEGEFATAMTLYVGLERLEYYGLRCFYNYITREPDKPYAKRIKAELEKIPVWRDMNATLKDRFIDDKHNSILSSRSAMSAEVSAKWGQNLDPSHPKIVKIMDIVDAHFEKYARIGETRVIIFTELRDSVTELVACLSGLKPRVKPMPFVGQAISNGKKGLSQKEQIEAIRKFKEGGYNTIVATCVAEEGLDIGEVDLIILFDVANTPVRFVQRMGRTGRKRDGKVVTLLTEGSEERSHSHILHTLKVINDAMMDKDKFASAMFTNAPRMIPIGLEPELLVMKLMERKWEDKTTKRKLHPNYFRIRRQGDREKIRLGRLTEEEEETYKEINKFSGPTMSLKDSKEFWNMPKRTRLEILCEDVTVDPLKIDLAEFNLWQISDQHRKSVSCSSLSKWVSDVNQMKKSPDIQRILDMRARGARSGRRIEERPLIDRKRKLSHEVEDVATAASAARQRRPSGEDEGKAVSVRQRMPSGDDKGKAKAKGTRGRNLSGEGMKSITSYFRPSQNKSQMENIKEPETKEQCANKKLNVIDEESNAESMPEVPDVNVMDTPTAIHPGMEALQVDVHYEAPTPEITIAAANESKVDYDFMDQTITKGGEDSGVSFSVHSPPVTNKVEQRFKVDKKQTEKSLFLEEANTKIHLPSTKKSGELPQHLLLREVDTDSRQPILVCPVTVAGKNASDEDMFNDFDSDFEEIDFSKMEVDFTDKGNIVEEKVESLSVTVGKEANFDIGSPILEEDKNFFDFEDNFEFDPASKEKSTSTPIHPMKVKGKTGSLRKSVLARKLEPEPEKKTNVSEDMFNESDDFDFDLDHMESGKPEGETTLYSATELIGMINESAGEYSKTPKTRKLSSIFAEQKPLTSETEKKPKEVNTSVDIFEGEATFDLGSQDFMIEDGDQVERDNGNDREDKDPCPDPGEGPSWKFDTRLKIDRSGTDPGEGHSREILKGNGKKKEGKKADDHPLDQDKVEMVQREEDQLTQECVSCFKLITGNNYVYNLHLDECLNKEKIAELTQLEDFTHNSSPQRVDSPDRSFDSPPSSPIDIDERNRKIEEILARNSFGGITQAKIDSSNASDDEEPPIFTFRSKKKKPSAKMFMDLEAEVSGDDQSDDDRDESAQHYEESFVDDASQDTDHAVYLRSVKSPEFRQPFSRPLPPITDDIFSQQVDNDTDQYEEDSFCMADSFVENDSHYDTLDLLERKAEDMRRKRKTERTEANDKKRRRIIAAASSDDESVVQTEDEKKDEIPKERKRIISLLSSDEESSPSEQTESNQATITRPKVTAANPPQNELDISDEYMSESMLEAKKMAVIVNHSEVNKANDLISNLRLVLGFNVIVPRKRIENVTFITGICSGAIRMSVDYFKNGANKEKMIKTIKEAKKCYKDLTIILEKEQLKPGERPRYKRRTKVYDRTLSQVLKTHGIKLLHSSGEEDTAAIVAKQVERAVEKGEGLPRQQYSQPQERMVWSLAKIAWIGVGLAYHLVTKFQSIGRIITASKETLMSKGIPESVASALVKGFAKEMNLADMDQKF